MSRLSKQTLWMAADVQVIKTDLVNGCSCPSYRNRSCEWLLMSKLSKQTLWMAADTQVIKTDPVNGCWCPSYQNKPCEWLSCTGLCFVVKRVCSSTHQSLVCHRNQATIASQFSIACMHFFPCCVECFGLQIGAVTMDRNADGTPELLVSQPGRTYVTLLPRSPARPDATTPIEGSVSPARIQGLLLLIAFM